MANITIVVRAYNESRHIERLLLGIQQQVGVTAQVILVDSGSTDSTVKIAQRYGAEIVSISPEDFTFGRALNLGIQHCKTETIVLASAHVYPIQDDWLFRLHSGLMRSNETAVCYGRQVGNEITKYSEHRIFAKWFPQKSEPNQKHPFCNNANAAVRRSVWEKYHYHDTISGLEDLEFAKRVLNDGYNISYDAQATIAHVHEETLSRIYNRYRREALALRNVYPGEKLGVLGLIGLWAGNTVSDVYHAAIDRAPLRSFLDIPLFRAMQFLGAYKGINQEGEMNETLHRRFYYPNSLHRTTPAVSNQPKINYQDLGASSSTPSNH